jgi:hypothetical protein
MPERLMLEGAREARGRKIAVIDSTCLGLALSVSLVLGREVGAPIKSRERTVQLTAGRMPIVEDGLAELIEETLVARRVRLGIDNARVLCTVLGGRVIVDHRHHDVLNPVAVASDCFAYGGVGTRGSYEATEIAV